MSTPNTIDYVEFPSPDLEAAKAFFVAAFGWSFEDYGPDYASFAATEAGVAGGFFRSELAADTARGSALVVLYAEDLEGARERVRDAGGEIVQDIFSFPGGRRFHFREPSGNELAVWSDRGA